jgi:septal ring factor EnvC (AmiA/AmiB activator)
VLDSLLSHLPQITSLLSAVLGGGLVTAALKWYKTYWTQRLKSDQQEHDQNIEMSSHLEQRMKDVEGRLDTAESELRATKKELTESRIKRRELRAAIDTLVQRIDRLIDRLEQRGESISAEERERLTKVPFTDE